MYSHKNVDISCLGVLEESHSKTYGFIKEIQAFLTQPLILLRFYKLFQNTRSDSGVLWGPSNFQKCMVILGKYKDFRNLCYHGTGSEEGAREEYAGNRKEQVCRSSVLEETEKKYIKVSMRNRMPMRHQR